MYKKHVLETLFPLMNISYMVVASSNLNGRSSVLFSNLEARSPPYDTRLSRLKNKGLETGALTGSSKLWLSSGTGKCMGAGLVAR